MVWAAGFLLALTSCGDRQPQVDVEPESAGGKAEAHDVTGSKSSKPPDLQKARADLIHLEEDYVRALTTKDRAFLERYYAPDFRGGNWMGFWTKSTMLKAVLDDRYTVKSMELSSMQVRIVGTIGIVQGVSDEVTSVNGQDTSGKWTFTDVFQWNAGEWRVVASHTAEVNSN
jgi:hypothetical protein